MKKYYTRQVVLYYNGNFCFQLCYHSENMQLVTHPVDTVKQRVAAKRKFNLRVAHSNEDCRKNIVPLPQQPVRSLDRLLHKKCSGKNWAYCSSRLTIAQLLCKHADYPTLRTATMGINQNPPSTQTSLNHASASKLEWKTSNPN